MRKKRFSNFFYDYVQPLISNKKSLAGSIILLFFILMATIGPMIVPLNMNSDFANRYQRPSLQHPFGTDYFGVDIFQQIVHGSRSVISLTLLASLFAVIIGTVVGVARGYLEGISGKLLDAIITVFLVIPSFPALLILAAIFADTKLNTVEVALIVAIWLWAPLAKQVAAQVLTVKSREFVEASRMLNMGLGYILFSDIAKLLIPYIFVNFVTQLKSAMEFSIGLMFLGLAKFDPTHWGVMLNYALYQAGALYTPKGFHYPFFVILNIVLLIYGGILLAQGIEEVFNPKLRGHE
ncbi:binding-protein-dependent transport systems inner membrane component [Caldicellulosiruptor hydrothermalis 108]|uniref:Binding-protein-dependent transport systems inner membrane component n=1 Tax=Caldicellulosiruptor hydrothermalis (strain DSM 18901 / VKM B-2411 / 108) TaxID=632292 RepID=E4Q8C4_CALH1|nr:ABC transporter permease [Caldicellulosiruptor hydrothermalis]ADQ07971.1 binding-protein-dependent transport systems inner membrane component [Caldicellulosiruptor hydrothermalis 108]